MAKSKTTKQQAAAKAKPRPKKGTKKLKPPPPAAGKRPAAAAPPALGRVLVTQEEKLYLLFHEDYHARQIFEFLRAETVHDLEQFTPQQIVKLLSQPIQKTVQRIRERLAEKNRHLAGDEAFVVQYKQSHPSH